MDIKTERKKPGVDPQWIDFAEKYNARYGNKLSAAEVIEESFNYSFEQLIEMAGKGDKIHFNKSMELPVKAARFALFRYMALDLLKGAQVANHDDCHHGHKVQINSNVKMLPSEPENVLQFKKDDPKGSYRPVVIVHHRQRDDFTPSAEDCLKSFIPYGVDPASAKWILEQLTSDEKEHLFNLLMSPVIENEHADLVKAKEFMQNKLDPRAELVRTAYNLICNMAAAFDGKFKDTVFSECYQKHLDMDDYELQAFAKEEDIDYTHVKDVETPTGPKVLEWTLDLDVIGDKRPNDAKPRQSEFVDTIVFSQVKQMSFFNNLDKDIIKNPEPKDKKFPTSTLAFNGANNNYDINKQYWLAHQMIGANAAGEGGQRCLFSNLLAVLVSNKNDLTDHNANCMRRAMANYLDKLQRAREKWNRIKNLPDLPEDSNQLKEMAELAERFEKLIAQTHKTTVPAYQLWLRKEPASFIGGQYVFPAQNLEAGGLTELEVLLSPGLLV